MSNITTIAGLRNAIKTLEDEQAANWELLKRQFTDTYEVFRPVNLIRNALKKVVSPSFLINKLLGPSLGLAMGYFFRK
ncbi:MAG: hypothetical protein ABR974_00780 [Bacteroidales bacterium]|jgi:hypothetical protein